MSSPSENNKEKISSLMSGFSKLGFNSDSKIDKEELINYLNSRSSNGKFDQVISEIFFQALSIDDSSSIPIKDFISGYLQFEEDIITNAKNLNLKLIKEKEKYESLLKNSDNNKESYENAKILGEITEIDIKNKLKGIEEIIITAIFNDKKEEFRFKLGEESNEEMERRKFEFTPTSRQDEFKLVIQGVNPKKKVFDIAKKVFPLKDVKNTEKYLVKIFAPEDKDNEKISAHIIAKITLIWNNLNYEQQKNKLESRIKKLEIACKNAEEYWLKVIEIYQIPNLGKGKDSLFNKMFPNGIETSLAEYSRKVSAVQDYDNQPRDKDEEDEDESNMVGLGYYKNELKCEKRTVNNLQKGYINNINNAGEVNNANITNDGNLNEYPVNSMINTGELVNSNINQQNEIYGSTNYEGLNQQGTNEAIYESDVKTIPIIIGQSEISNLQSSGGLDYDTNNLIQQSVTQENIYENGGYTQNEGYTQGTQIDTYGQINQTDNYSQLNADQNYATTNLSLTYSQSYADQNYDTTNQLLNYSQIAPYQTKTYQARHRRYDYENPQSDIQINSIEPYQRTTYAPNYSQQLSQIQSDYSFTPITTTYRKSSYSTISPLYNSQIINSSNLYTRRYYHATTSFTHSAYYRKKNGEEEN